MNKIIIFLTLLVLTIPIINANVEIGSEEGTGRQGVDIEIPDAPAFNNNTGSVNASEIWITNIGNLDDVNATQMSNEGGVLNILESWVKSIITIVALNPFDQSLNTTDDVVHNNLNITQNISLGDSMKDSDTFSRVYFNVNGTFVIEG